MVRASAKVQQHKICRFQYLPSNRIIANIILIDLDLLFQIVACEIKYSDTYLLVIDMCAVFIATAPLSMSEPVVNDAHKQAIVTTSANAFDNGMAHRFQYLKSGDYYPISCLHI